MPWPESEALEAYEKVLSASPAESGDFAAAADLDAQLGHGERAKAILQQAAVSKSPGLKPVADQLGEAFKRANNGKETPPPAPPAK